MQTNSSWQIEQRLPQVSRDLFNGRLESVLHYNESYPSFSESLLHSKVHNYSILELPQRGWELARFMKTENFLRSSAHPLENSEGANLCFRNLQAQFKLKKTHTTLPAGDTVFLSCLFQRSPGCSPQPLWHRGNITFKSLCTISCWWMWFTLSSIWWIQWLQDKGRDTQSYAHTHTHTWHLISSQNYFPNFYICTRASSRPQAEFLHHAHWLPQLSTVTAGHPHPPQQQDAKHPIYSRTTKPLSCLPSPPSFPPHHTKHLTCSFSQQCPPHTGELRHPSICKWQPRLGRQDPITPGNIQLG